MHLDFLHGKSALYLHQFLHDAGQKFKSFVETRDHTMSNALLPSQQ